MKLKQYRVREFRSIWDSGPIEVDAQTTCFVGKNEAGKTTVLTALYRSNPIRSKDAVFDETYDYPKREVEDYSADKNHLHSKKDDLRHKYNGKDAIKKAKKFSKTPPDMPSTLKYRVSQHDYLRESVENQILMRILLELKQAAGPTRKCSFAPSCR